MDADGGGPLTVSRRGDDSGLINFWSSTALGLRDKQVDWCRLAGPVSRETVELPVPFHVKHGIGDTGVGSR